MKTIYRLIDIFDKLTSIEIDTDFGDKPTHIEISAPMGVAGAIYFVEINKYYNGRIWKNRALQPRVGL